MADPFAQLIPEAKTFLAELTENNSREWFHASKTRYDSQLKTPSKLLQEQISAVLKKSTGLAVTTKLFRPQRDIRFSKDKTPYHTHLHMFWQLQGPLDFGLFLGISPSYCKIGGGVMSFDKTQLLAWRDSLDSSQGPAIATALDRLAQQGFTAEEPELKRVPTAYDKDHPQADLLRRKSLTLWRELPSSDWPQPITALETGFTDLLQLQDVLTHSLAVRNTS
ncbi:TIGR02453 family protein [Sedimentitalea sp. CY04]|uniref:TIGR02453 family protein n=1 Tax=Parasedimentitalea denitrificans TaxID=2211118 RepID=A0ABX0W412_9RHOB|nr:TIGR02453 family protein [Sedimentitalea sp. CY04]NIZ60078.1 TIGR02453 family protein [Sedimentitalea sp. CY04]